MGILGIKQNIRSCAWSLAVPAMPLLTRFCDSRRFRMVFWVVQLRNISPSNPLGAGIMHDTLDSMI